MEGKVVLRKGPQEYHSAPGGLSACGHFAWGRADTKRVEMQRTGEARSAVVEPAKGGDGSVDKVATGKDIGLADNALAIITTT